MRPNARQERGSYASAIHIAEEGLQLVFRAGWNAWFTYIIGSLPFCLGLTWYCAAMMQSSLAHRYTAGGALLVALLFVWMKTFQSRYAQHLRAALLDDAPPPWGLAAMLRTLCRQAALQTTAVLVLPVGFVTLIPMAYSLAWYQNLLILDRGDATPLRTLARDAARLAILWPKQNHALLWVCSPLLVVLAIGMMLTLQPVIASVQTGYEDILVLVSLASLLGGIFSIVTLPLAPTAVVLAIGYGASIFMVFELGHIFTGADTLFNRSPGALMQNEVFLALVATLTYLSLDPVIKGAYAIRCHRGESLQTGADIHVALARLRKLGGAAALVVLASTILFAGRVGAQETATPTPRAEQLERAIQEELAESRYTWRAPRTVQPSTEQSWLAESVENIAIQIRDAVKRTWDWITETYDRIRRWVSGEPRSGAGGAGFLGGQTQSLRMVVIIIAIVLVVVTAYVVWAAMRNRRVAPLEGLSAVEMQAPDLADEATTAADLPEDDWSRLARELAEAGDFRLAARALFFASLATLARQEYIRIARFKSNRDYRNELARRAAGEATGTALFSQLALTYEMVWYGKHRAGPDTLDQMNHLREQLHHGG